MRARPTVLCLTGSIAMGKSTAADAFRRLGVPVFDADAEVHRLLARGGAAVARVAGAFPGVLADGAIDRRALGALVFGDAPGLRRLEAILHPMVGVARQRFLRRAAARRVALVVLDIPLLFEGGGARHCGHVVVVSAPAFVQRARALSRDGMTAEKFAAILAQQTPDAEKRARADFVIPTGLGKRHGLDAIRRLLAGLSRPAAGTRAAGG
jgi:dephospho-CoA kinase